jgi:P27 family predicted phage terminase small subunit
LSKEAVAEWHRFRKSLEAAGTLERTDPMIVHMWVHAWSNYQAAQRDIQESGITLVSITGELRRNPACVVVKQSADTMHDILNLCGLTPKSSKLRGPSSELSEDEAAWAELLGDSSVIPMTR